MRPKLVQQYLMAVFGHVQSLLPLPKHTTFLHSSFTKPNIKSNIPQHHFIKYSSCLAAAAAEGPTLVGGSSSSISKQTGLEGWGAFAKNVSGEWDGFGAEFSARGEPIELPESVVPEAYREWEVKVFDWQTQCPTLADVNADSPSFVYSSIRLLPTVGCEADAATRHSIDERSIAHPELSAFAFQPTGCYVAAWSGNMGLSWELEYCFIDPRDRKSRVRIIQVVQLRAPKLVLQRIKVFCEHWYGPFRNGDQLGGCATQDSAFASTKALDPALVIGVWEGKHAISTFHKKAIQELVECSTRKTVRDEVDLVLLPKQLWCCLKDNAAGETCCEVGWLLEKGRAMTSKCIFSDCGELKEVAIACESAESAQIPVTLAQP